MNIMRTTIGQFILLVAVLADLVTMILLMVDGGIHGQGAYIWLIGILVVFTAISYILGVQFKRMYFKTDDMVRRKSVFVRYLH